jgi:hypothetical protein
VLPKNNIVEKFHGEKEKKEEKISLEIRVQQGK